VSVWRHGRLRTCGSRLWTTTQLNLRIHLLDGVTKAAEVAAAAVDGHATVYLLDGAACCASISWKGLGGSGGVHGRAPCCGVARSVPVHLLDGVTKATEAAAKAAEGECSRGAHCCPLTGAATVSRDDDGQPYDLCHAHNRHPYANHSHLSL
jgi:hypothetical protein